jgi:phosphohistidine phosphatase SixA
MSDHDRPLSKAGRADAISVSNKLQQMGWVPELILCRCVSSSNLWKTVNQLSWVIPYTNINYESFMAQLVSVT